MKSLSLVHSRFFFTLCLLTFIGIYISCNNDRGRGPRPGLNISDLKTQLDLTDEQSKKIEQIIETTRQEMQDLRESSSGDWRENREQMLALRNKQNEQIEALLTDDQKVKWEVLKKERQDRLERRRRGDNNEQ